jgi:hypothetical protein
MRRTLGLACEKELEISSGVGKGVADAGNIAGQIISVASPRRHPSNHRRPLASPSVTIFLRLFFTLMSIKLAEQVFLSAIGIARKWLE